LRSGSGTRIKVLEAFAHRVPVVSTTLGCEGLGVQPGREALVADTPEAFADACIRLATDPALADSIAGRGHERWLDQFQWSQIRADVTALVRAVAG
jgi:glycosyltransferase involved in cell wall biosynthesis